VGTLALLRVEVLGYSKMLEKASSIFMPEDSIMIHGIILDS
jgi:hypothetical protein